MRDDSEPSPLRISTKAREIHSLNSLGSKRGRISRIAVCLRHNLRRVTSPYWDVLLSASLDGLDFLGDIPDMLLISINLFGLQRGDNLGKVQRVFWLKA